MNDALTKKCVFCSEPIQAGDLDPCELLVTAGIEQPRDCQKEQAFFCHIDCLRDRIHPSLKNLFYIAQRDYATIGELEENANLAEEERILH